MMLRMFFGCLFLLLSSLLFLACEEQTEWALQPEGNQQLAVEAILTDENKFQEVRLSLSYGGLNGAPPLVADAQVRVVGEGRTVWFRSDARRPGWYVSGRPFSARMFEPYLLEINWNGQVYRAVSYMVNALPMPGLTFQPAGADSLTIGSPPAGYLPNEQAMYEIDIFSPDATETDSARAKLLFYMFSTIDVPQLFRPARETVAFPRGSIIIRRKYSLAPEFAAYLRALLLETEWQGGVFDDAPGNLPTNISEGGLGFFAVCSVLSDTLVAR